VVVGDLIVCEHYGVGIVTGVRDRSFEACFHQVGKKGWFGYANLGASMELISESR